ncbi:hypothetical protein EC957_007708 [Mortierella hygrophila]|uniref:Uncharacterized protein n=1 Tax=Mortierella hygrophila TaxID=979708 RepID=A0A9P6JYF2_9FUNG|nr:hypothetical protein EC957_007708 [Mortierella hygrophila]
MAIPDDDKSCPFNDCRRLEYYTHSTEKGKEHFNRYHESRTQTIRLEGAKFYVRRDPSVDYEYVCLCGSSLRSRYIFGRHVAGDSPRGIPPCSRMYEKALEIVATNAVFMDKTQPMNYEPSPDG